MKARTLGLCAAILACGSGRHPESAPCFESQWLGLIKEGYLDCLSRGEAEYQGAIQLSPASTGGEVTYASSDGCIFRFAVDGTTASLVNAPVNCYRGSTRLTITSYTMTTTDGRFATIDARGQVAGKDTCALAVTGTLQATSEPAEACTAARLGVGKVEVVSGDGQAGIAARTLPAPIRLRALRADGSPAAAAVVNVSVAEGSGTASATSLKTGADGTASFEWTLPAETQGGKSLLVTSSGLFAARVQATSAFGTPSSLSIDTHALTEGTTMRLAATARDAQGQVVGAGIPSWTSTAPSILRINEDGTATGVAVGSAPVTATLAGVSASRIVYVALRAGTGTPSIDGVVGPDWGGAPSVPITVNEESGPAEGRLYFMGGPDNAYIGVTFPQPGANFRDVTVWFDKDEDGAPSAGDDVVFLASGAFHDGSLTCGDPDACFAGDPANRVDGTMWAGNDGTKTMIEMLRPRATNDPYDMPLPRGAPVGIRLRIVTLDFHTGTTFFESTFPQSGYFQVAF